MTNPRLEVRRESPIARAWRIAIAHMQLGEVPLERTDIATIPPAAKPVGSVSASEDRGAPLDQIDLFVDESFPASDPPSWTTSHA